MRAFAESVGLPCVSLLGSQLAPEDIIGVPQIVDGKSRFCPPTLIARDGAYCLFLDELNACSQEVQKAFYSLILDRRIGEFNLSPGTIVIGAGNRIEDAAITRPLSSALVNRLVHVQLRASARDWLDWAGEAGVHELVVSYISNRSDHLWSKPPKHEEPFSTPRAWDMLSKAIGAYGPSVSIEDIKVLASGLLTPAHAQQFVAFARLRERQHDLSAILKGERRWPDKPEERDILYFLTQQLRDRLIKELPEDEDKRAAANRREVAEPAGWPERRRGHRPRTTSRPSMKHGRRCRPMRCLAACFSAPSMRAGRNLLPRTALRASSSASVRLGRPPGPACRR